MRWRTPLAVVVCCALAVTPFALADEANVPATQSSACTYSAEHKHDAKRTLKRAWSHGRWKQRRPVKRSERRRLAAHRECLTTKDHRALKRFAQKRKRHFRLYRTYRKVAPYRCQRGAFGFWAKPCYVIACESRFSWGAYNPSGARGPYQFVGWRVPWPVRSFRDKVAHHVMASKLGLSHWVCA